MFVRASVYATLTIFKGRVVWGRGARAGGRGGGGDFPLGIEIIEKRSNGLSGTCIPR